MPFDPPRGGLARGLITSLINQRFQEQTLERERQLREIERKKASEMALWQTAVEGDGNLEKLAPLLSTIDSSLIGAGKEIQKMRKKAAEEKEQLSSLTAPTRLAQLGEIGAARPGPSGRMVAGNEAEYQGGLQALGRQLGPLDPIALTNAVQQIESARVLREQAGREQLASESRGEAQAIRGEARAEARQNRSDTVAALSEVFAGGDPASANVALQASLRQNPRGFGQIIDQAITRSEALKAQDLRKLKTPEGRDADTRLAESIERIRAAQGQEYPGRGFDEAIVKSKKLGFFDPVSGRLVLSDNKELEKRRQRIVSLPPLISTVEDSIAEIGQEIRENKLVTAGGLMGADSVVQAARAVGVQTKGVARFHLLQQQLLLQLARMDQDARLSDFDLARWLAVVPGLPDLKFDANGNLSEQAQGRLQAIGELLDLERQYGLGDAGPTPPNLAVPSAKAMRAAAALRAKPDLEGASEALQLLNSTTPKERGTALVDEFYGSGP